MSGPTRVAVVQIDGQPAASLPSCLDPLGDPLFSEKHGGVLPMAGDVDEPLQPTIRELRDRVRRTYCDHQARKVRAILDACRGWGVKVVVFPEYSIPWQVLDEVAAAAGEMVMVAGTHAVTQQGRTSGVYERLGTQAPRGNEAVAPVLYQGKALALVPKLHAAPPERGGLREADAWSHVTLPTGLPSPLGVLICLDFLVQPGHQPSDVTRAKLAEARLLAVPSWTPTHTLREFEGAAWASAVRGRTPVLYANVAAQGGSTIYADTEYGKDAGRFPSQVGRLDAGDEGVVVVDIDLSDQRRGTRSMYLDHRIVRPFAQASLVYQTHPAGLAYARWLAARAADLASDDLAPLVTALRADDAVLRAAGQLPGATARGLRVRRLFGDLELLNEVHEVARLLREVVLPTEVVPHPALLAALANGAETHLNDVLFRPDTRDHARELVAARDALHKGAALVGKLSDAEWTAEARGTLATLAASVRGAVPAVAEPAVRVEVRVEPRPLPRALPLLSLPDQTVTLDGAARRLVFRATAREALAGLYREVPGEASLGQRITDVVSDNRDARIVDTAALVWRAEARAAVVLALGPTQERLAELAGDDMQLQYVLARGMGRLALYGFTPWSRLALLERTHDGCRVTSLRAPKDVQSHWDDRMKDAVGQALHDLGLGPVEWIEEPPATIAGRVVGLRRRIEAARDTIVELRERRLREVGGHYVDPDVEAGDRRVPAREALDGWLADGGPPLALVLGEFGAGKSTLLADWCLHRWQTDAVGPLPVLVDLAGAGEHADALTLVLGACGLDDSDASRATVAVLVREGHLVPCFDGFDEMATRLQAEALAGRLASLTRIVADGGRAVVSSRSNYFPREQDLQAAEQALAEVLARSAAHQRVEVRPFDEDHIRRLVTSVAGGAAAPELLRRIQTTYDLRDLARRPLLLGMVLQTLERLPAGKRVTQAVLYEQYLARWLANTHVGDQEVFTDAQKRAFAEALAEALWRTGASSLTWQALHGTVRELLFRELPDDVPGGSGFLEIAGGAFFIRDGDDQYRFAHKSFLEYFLARSLVRSLAAGTTRGLDTRPLSTEVIAFALEVLSLEAADAPWRHPAIATVQRWLEVGRAAEGEPVTTANAAANALRFLVGLGRSTYPDRWLPDRADLRKVVLDGEDLSGAILRAADLSGASLRGVRLSDVVLDDARLDGAILDGATLDRASLHRASARGTSFVQASATDAELRGANLDGANLRQSVWVGGTWADCSYAGATATSAIVAGPQGAPHLPSLDLVAHLGSGHVGMVMSVGWSADGRVVSGGSDGRVCVWDGATLARQGEVKAHAGSVMSVGWSADGQIVSGGDDGRLCVWDRATLAQQGEARAHAGSVLSVRWSADGRIVSGGDDGRVCVWDGATLARQGEAQAHADRVRSVGWSADGRVVSGGADGRLCVWDGATLARQGEVQAHAGSVVSVGWSADGRVVSGGSDGRLCVWDGTTLARHGEVQAHTGSVVSVERSADGRVVSGGADGRLCVWDGTTLARHGAVQAHAGYIMSVGWSADGRVVSGGADGRMWVWDGATLARPGEVQAHAGSVVSVGWSTDGRVVSGGSDGQVCVWDGATLAQQGEVQAHAGHVMTVGWSADGRVVSGGDDGRVCVWDGATLAPEGEVQAHADWVMSVRWSADGRIVSGGADGRLCVWDGATLTRQGEVHAHADWVVSVGWSADGRVVSGGTDGRLCVWDGATLARQGEVQAHPDWVVSVGWSADGRIASGGADGRVCVWDGATLARQGEVQAHARGVVSVGWSADGRVVSGGDDGQVCVHLAGEAGLQPMGHLELLSTTALARVPSGYVSLASAELEATWQLTATLDGRRLAIPSAPLRRFFERPDLVARSLAGETIASTPIDDLRAAGWSPGPAWDGADVTLGGAGLALPPPATRPNLAATVAFVPGPALVEVAALPGRDALLDELTQLARARTPTALLGPRRVGKTSMLHALAERLGDTFEVHHATLEGAHLDSRDDLARLLAPALRDHASPADALLRARPPRPAIYLLDELAWLQRLPADHLPWLRALGQHAAMVVLAGTHQDWRTVAAHARSAPGSSFANDVFVIDLGPLATADALAFLTSRSEERISHVVAELVVEAVGGWPFYLQVMGFALEHELRVGRPVVTRDQVLAVRHQRLVVDRDTVFAGRWHELPRLARAVLLDHLNHLPRLDDLDLDTTDAIVGAGLATPGGLWLDDIPFFQWIRLHARRLNRAEGR